MPPEQAIQTYLDHLDLERGLADNTLESYGSDLARFLNFLKKQKITGMAAVDTTVLLAWIIALKTAGLSAPSRARHLIAVRGLFRHLVQTGVLSVNPAAQMDIPKPAAACPIFYPSNRSPPCFRSPM